MEGFGPIVLTGVLATGVVTQLYPTWASSSPGVTVGAALPVPAQTLYRRPAGGKYGQVSIETDSVDGGIIQLYDINGLDVLADVSSSNVITNAQLVAALAANVAKLIFEQNFAAAPGAPIIWDWQKGFLRGLAARYVVTSAQVSAGATCKLNIIGEGSFQYLTSAGVYAGG